MERVCVFCGASSGKRAAYAEAARRFGAAVAARGLGVVYGGGKVGLMGALAEGALGAGGEVYGVIPQELVDRELAHEGLTELHVVGSLHERKALMAELADGFIALPGGWGTWEEFFEVLTWGQLGLHEKPCGLLNVQGYFTPMLAAVDHSIAEGFVRMENRSMVIEAASAGALIDAMRDYRPVRVTKWITERAT